MGDISENKGIPLTLLLDFSGYLLVIVNVPPQINCDSWG